MLALTVIRGLEQGKVLPLNQSKKSYVLGRSENLDYVFKDPGISRAHAEVFYRDKRWHLKDKGSSNGTYLNGLPVEEKTIGPQDIIALGSVELLVVSQNPEEPKDLKNITQGFNVTDAFDLTRRIGSSIIGKSKQIQDLIGHILKLSMVETTVLIHGETGSGKELVARALHAGSARQKGPFVAVNCAAIPENLFESEFFGHEKGAFTGAQSLREGYFEQACQGTIFLDEIGDLPLAAQAKLLRVLEARRIRRVGATEDTRLDVRVIAATHRDLQKRVAEKEFREDLFHRLRVVELHVPALRERQKDIVLLSDYFLTRMCHERSRKISKISKEAYRVLLSYAWPGNIRELKNVLERALLLSEGQDLGVEHLSFLAEAQPIVNEEDFKGLKEFEREQSKKHILKALNLAQGNKSKAAKLLGISRPVLYEKIKNLGIGS
jgi:two-component system response regulator AtoC